MKYNVRYGLQYSEYLTSYRLIILDEPYEYLVPLDKNSSIYHQK